MKFRKKPVVIEAVQLCRKNWDDVCALMADAGPALHAWQLAETCSDPCDEPGPYIELPIPTLEGIHLAKHGDWIIKGVRGELYPCKPDIFAATYEAAALIEGDAK